MKVRKGFVSNNSSSSFICEICGESASGWDMCLDQAEMFICEECGTTQCLSHQISFSDTEKLAIFSDWIIKTLSYDIQMYKDKIKKINDSGGDSSSYTTYLSEYENRLDSFNKILESEYENDLDIIFEFINNSYMDFKDNYPKEFCKICALDRISYEDVNSYLIKKSNYNIDSIKE